MWPEQEIVAARFQVLKLQSTLKVAVRGEKWPKQKLQVLERSIHHFIAILFNRLYQVSPTELSK